MNFELKNWYDWSSAIENTHTYKYLKEQALDLRVSSLRCCLLISGSFQNNFDLTSSNHSLNIASAFVRDLIFFVCLAQTSTSVLHEAKELFMFQ